MKVEITQIRKTTVDIGPCCDSEIENKVLNIYNQLKDSDFSIINTEMYYKPLPRTVIELGIKYKIVEFSEFLVKYAYERYGGICLIDLQILLYCLTEEYYKKGIKLFDDDFITYNLYPKSTQIDLKYYMYLNNTISLFGIKETLKVTEINDDILSFINTFLKTHKKIMLYDVDEILKDTVWYSMRNAGVINKEIIFL